jgi:DNA-directed RNA polymerase specialized sigma24 family protein
LLFALPCQSQIGTIGKVRIVSEWVNHSDEDLLLATSSDPEAFGAFYQRHEDAVLRFFFRCVRDAELAADLSAETFARALLGARRFRRRREPASARLFGSATALPAEGD